MSIALGYIRRSYGKAGQATTSPEKQRDGIAARAQESSWPVEWFEDIEGHRSGRSERARPAWGRLKERVAASRPGEISAVIVWAVDRSSRSARDFFNFLALLQERHVEFVSVTQAQLDSTTPFGRAMLGLLIIWAALEADIDSQRATETITYKQQSGVFVGDVPYGYRREVRTIQLPDGQTATTGVLVEEPDEADVVRLIFQRYASGRFGRRSLADHLNTLAGPDGQPLRFHVKKRNKVNGSGARIPFTDEHVRCILENHWLYRGHILVREGAEDERRVPAVHPALVNDELAEQAIAVQRTRGENQIGRKPSQQHVYVLHPLSCAFCGQDLEGTRWRGESYYRHPRKRQECRAPAPCADALEAEFLEPFRTLRLSDEDVDDLEELWRRSQPDGSWQPSTDLVALRARVQRAKRLFLAGDLSEVEYFAEKRALAAAEEQGLGPTATPRRLAEALREFGEVIRTAEPQAQRQMIFGLYERIETDGLKITKAVPRPWFQRFFGDLASLGKEKAAGDGVKTCCDRRSRGVLEPGVAAGLVRILSWSEGVAAELAERHVRRDARRELMADLVRAGQSYGQIARQFGVSRQRVAQLLSHRPAPPAARPAPQLTS